MIKRSKDIMESFRTSFVHKIQLKLQGNKMVTKPAFHKHMQRTPYFPGCASRVVQVFYVYIENNLFFSTFQIDSTD